MVQRLKEMGVDVKARRRCLGEACEDSGPARPLAGESRRAREEGVKGQT